MRIGRKIQEYLAMRAMKRGGLSVDGVLLDGRFRQVVHRRACGGWGG